MDCHVLTERILSLQPSLTPIDVARLALLLLQHCDHPERLADDDYLMQQWNEVSFRLEMASEEYNRLTEDLNGICDEGPLAFSPDQLWTLVRAIQVQSNYLDLYVDSDPIVAV